MRHGSVLEGSGACCMPVEDRDTNAARHWISFTASVKQHLQKHALIAATYMRQVMFWAGMPVSYLGL